METKTKRKYVAPAVLDTLWLEMDEPILQSSKVGEPIDDDVVVETMGQEIGGTLDGDAWNHTWGE